MDLSGLIFVALFAAWAIYLIPRALHQHDELARTRSVDKFSDRVRVFAAGLASREPEVATAPASPAPVVPVGLVEEAAGRLETAATTRRPNRDAARRAAARRRQILLGLVLGVVITGAAAGFRELPWWSTVVPVSLVFGFLVVARLAVRAQRPRVAAPVAAPAAVVTEPVVEEATQSPSRNQVDESDGALWDPLPMQLPTYVTAPAARRTNRSIELTGVVSSGHDEEDSRLAREVEFVLAAELDEEPERRAAGA